MKNKFLKLTSLLLAMFMFTAVFYGCKQKEGDDNQEAGTKTAAKTTAGKTSSPGKTTGTAANKTGNATSGTAADKVSEKGTPSSNTDTVVWNDDEQGDEGGEGDTTPSGNIPNKKTYDLKGRVIKVLCQSNETAQWPTANAVSKSDQVRYNLMVEAEKLYNCKFEFEVVSSWDTLKMQVENSVLAGVYFADVFRMVRSTAFPKYEKYNIILPLNDYIDFEQPVYKKFDQVNGLINPDKIYAFYIGTPLIPTGVFYNKSIMEREGIPDIQELADRGEWNWQTFADIAKSTTRDIDGDGVIDQWGVGADNVTNFCIAIMRSNLASMIARTDSGEYVYNLQSPQALRALQFVSDLYHSYKVTPNKDITNDFKQGKAAMFVKDAWYGSVFKREGVTNLGFEIVPSGPDNSGNYYMREQGSHMFFFPSNLEDPEPVVNAMAHWCVIWDETKNYYVTDEEMVMSTAQDNFDTEENINNLVEMVTTKQILYDYIDYFSPSKTEITNNVFKNIAAQQITPVSSIEALSGRIQSIINDVMSN